MDPILVFGLPGKVNLEEMFEGIEDADALTPRLVRLQQQPIILYG